MQVTSNQSTWTITAGPHGAMIYLQTDSLRGGAILDNPDARKTLATKGLRTDVSLQDWDKIDKAVRAALAGSAPEEQVCPGCGGVSLGFGGPCLACLREKAEERKAEESGDEGFIVKSLRELRGATD